MPAGLIPQQWSADWFSNFLVTWLAQADYRNAVPGQVVVSTASGASGPGSFEVLPNSITGDDIVQAPPNTLFGNPTGATADHSDIPIEDLTAAPTALVKLTPITGTADSFLASDSAPALDPSISPTWTGQHTFNAPTDFVGTAEFAGEVGFNGTAPVAKPTITGSRGGNVALASLLTALAAYGLIVDSTT